jgi:hypothetical protein
MVEGLPKDIAWQQSLKTYFLTCDQLHAHPFFWGGHIIMGNVRIIEFASQRRWVPYLFAFIGM